MRLVETIQRKGRSMVEATRIVPDQVRNTRPLTAALPLSIP
jgi:hypothetical protein